MNASFGRQRRRLPAPGQRSRRALTLIEVLISLALSSLLLASVYSAITTYFHYSRAGQDEISKNQLARVLLQRIEQDLRSIVYRPDDGTSTADSSTTGSSTTGSSTTGGSTTGSGGGSTGGGSTGGGSSGSGSTSGGSASSGGSTSGSGTGTTGSSSSQTATDPAQAFASSASGLFGDTQTLVLHVSRPRLDMLATPSLNSPVMMSRTSDLKTVTYFVSGNGTGGLQAAAAAQFAVQNPNGNGRSQGLARMEGERLVLQTADKTGNVGSLLAQTQMLAPEVSRIAFRYYDGSVWSMQWDSANYGGLPRAVEVNIELTFQDQTTGQGRYKKTIKEPPRTYRAVVFLPISKPMLTTSY